jgi:hypothetical protein
VKAVRFLLSFLLLGLGAWGVLNPHSAPLEIAEIQGSRVNPTFPFRSEQNVLGGGDFGTFVPGAFVTVRFSRPYSFTHVRHIYPFSQYALPWLQVTAAELQWSDDGSNWQVADTATAAGGTMYFRVAAAGAHEWWRLVVVGWAGLPDLLLGNLWFDPADGPFTIPYDVSWGLLCAGVLGILLTFRALTAGRAWMLASAAAAAFVFSYALLLAPYQIISTNDSFSYVQPLLVGTYDSLRNIGYPNLVRLLGITIGLENLAIFQLLIQLLSLGVLSFVMWRCYGMWVALVAILGGALFLTGWIVFFAPYVLVESISTSALLLAAAGIIGASRHPSTRMFILAGAGLALATVAKSTGLAMALAAIPIVRFLPRGCRLRGVTLVVVPSIAAYLLMSAHHYAREGLFAPEAASGLVLLGHIGWMLQGELPQYPGLIEKLQEAAAPSFAGKPPAGLKISSWTKLDDYVDYTSQLEDWLMVGKIIPALRQYDPKLDWIKMNSISTQVAFVSIAADPRTYARHVAAHFYGMWRQVGRAWIDLQSGTIGFRSAYELQLEDFREGGSPFRTLLGPPFTAERVREAARRQATVTLASNDLLDYLAPIVRDATRRGYLSLGLGAISLLLCAAIFFPGRFATAYRAEIMLAFVLNAYMLAHALVVWSSVHRYVAPVIPVIFAFALCLLHTSLRIVGPRMGSSSGKSQTPIAIE